MLAYVSGGFLAVRTKAWTEHKRMHAPRRKRRFTCHTKIAALLERGRTILPSALADRSRKSRHCFASNSQAVEKRPKPKRGQFRLKGQFWSLRAIRVTLQKSDKCRVSIHVVCSRSQPRMARSSSQCN